MNAAVAWHIENSMRSKSGNLKITLDAINANNKGGFDVTFNVNDKVVKSEWIKEYGVYRMNTYGELAAGGKTLLDEKEKKKAQDKALRTDYDFAVSAGYAQVFDYGHALHVAIRKFSSPFTQGFDFFYGFNDKDYIKLGFNLGFAVPIRLDTFAITPFGEAEMAYLKTFGTKKTVGFPIAYSAKGGLMFTSAKVPGLFIRSFYEYNFAFLNDSYKKHGIFVVGAGYGF